MESIEQQIYASLALPGLKPGHHTHAHTGGLDAAAIEQHERICNQWGEYEPGADFTRALVQMPLWNGAAPPAMPSHYAVIYITYQGRDAGGRPGALLRHIVRLPADIYASLDYNPFHLQRHAKLLAEWAPGTPFPEVDFPSAPTSAEDLKGIFPERHALLRGLLTRLLADGELHLPAASDSPAAEELFGELMELVPVARRQWMSLATFAYKNAANFTVAAMRQEEASFRRSLEAVQEPRLTQLPAAAAAYVGDLFAAMSAGNWGQAASLVRRSEVGSLAASAAAAPSADGDAGGRAGALPTAGAPPVGTGPLPFQVRAGPPPPAPPLPSAVPRRRRSRAPALLLGVVLLAAVAVVAVVMVRRGSDQGPVGRRSSEQIRRASAASLAALVDEHERILAGMLAKGARDFDLTEAMTSAVETLPERAQAAIAAEGPAVEEALKEAAAAARGEAGLSALAARMAKLAEGATSDAARLHGLRQLLLAQSSQRLRAAYDPQRQVVHVPPGEGDADEPVLASIFVRAQSMHSAATAFQQLAGLPPQASAAAWSDIARALQQAADSFPEEWPAPSAVTLLASGVGALQQLLIAEQRAGLGALALAVPYRGTTLQQGELGQAATAAQQAAQALHAGELPLPSRLGAAAAFYAAAIQANAAAQGGPDGGQPRLAQATAVCAADTVPAPCGVADYAAHVARWKLEAWRALGGPDSERGQSALQKLGAASLPDDDPSALARTVELLGQIEAAPVPVPPGLADAVEAARGTWGDSFYGRLCADWMSRNRRQAISQQTGFKDAYGRLQAAVTALRSAREPDVPAAMEQLSQAVQRVQALDLAQAEAIPAERSRVQAARALVKGWGTPAPLPVERIDVQLLTEVDYSGARQQVARPRITVSRIGAGPADELLSALSPPMLAAPGTGFAPARVPIGKPLRIAPRDRLLVLGKDEGRGAPWFHVIVEAPREGHVATLLAAGLRARVTPQQAAQIAASGSPLSATGGDGAEVASIRFVFNAGWWQELANALPALP